MGDKTPYPLTTTAVDTQNTALYDQLTTQTHPVSWAPELAVTGELGQSAGDKRDTGIIRLSLLRAASLPSPSPAGQGLPAAALSRNLSPWLATEAEPAGTFRPVGTPRMSSGWCPGAPAGKPMECLTTAWEILPCETRDA